MKTDLIGQIVNELGVENQSGARGDAWLRDAGQRMVAVVLRDMWKLAPKLRPLIEQYARLHGIGGRDE